MTTNSKSPWQELVMEKFPPANIGYDAVGRYESEEDLNAENRRKAEELCELVAKLAYRHFYTGCNDEDWFIRWLAREALRLAKEKP